MSLMTLEQVSIGYSNRIIATDINLTLEEQQVICLLGANGCGKTTLLKSMLGLIPTHSGKIIIGEQPLTHWQPKALAKFIAYVPQAHHSLFPYTVEEVVLMGRHAHLHWLSVPGNKDCDVAAQALTLLRIDHLAQRHYTELSGGERQLVLIARALAQEPKVLIMDEPAASLDFGNQIRVLEQIKQLKPQGISVIMTTHHPQHAFSVADKVVLMKAGKLIKQGSCQAVLTADNLADLYDVTRDKIIENLPETAQNDSSKE